MNQLLPCQIKSETKAITVGEKVILQCLLSTEQINQKFEFQVLDAPEFSLQFLGEPQIKDKVLEQEVTSYKVGTYKFEKVSLKSGSSNNLVTPFELEVKTVIAEPSPTPFPNLGAQKIAAPWWWWVMWFLVLCGVVFYIVKEYKRWKLKKQQAANTAPVKVLTPFEKYKLQLQKLESQDLHLKGEYKKFALELTQIVKKAIGEELGFLSEDLTTEELIETLEKKHKNFWFSTQGILTNTFLTLDQIKFAKTPASADLCMSLLDSARHMGDALFKNAKTTGGAS